MRLSRSSGPATKLLESPPKRQNPMVQQSLHDVFVGKLRGPSGAEFANADRREG
jgi:hypothetical protein